jgi:hypothetical protein
VPSRIVSRPNPLQQKTIRPQERVEVLVWISHSDNGAYIEVYANPQRVRVRVVEELYCPGDRLEAAKICREIADLRLPGYWRAFYRREDVRVIASHFVERRRPSEEAYRLWRLEALRFIEDLPKRFPTLYPPKTNKKDREHV